MPPRNNKKISSVLYGDIFNSEMIIYYSQNIISFVYDIIFQNNPLYTLTEQQKDLLLSIQNNKRVAAKSGKGIGKTSSISFAILWFMCCFDSPKVICTAPSYPTLKSALWPEVAKWLGISAVKNIFTQTEDRLYLTEKPKVWFAEPRTAKEPENLQGLHADNLLIIVDEASGIKQVIYDALDTTLTGENNRLVLIGNPTQVSGPFYDAFNKFTKKWIIKTYSSLDSPIVQKDQIEYYTDRYGIHHDLYLVNILGEFPTGSPDAFIKLSDIHAAVQRWHDSQDTGDIEIGVDVARFGDDTTVMYWRKGLKVYPATVLAKSSIVEVSRMVLDKVTEIRRKTSYDKTIKIKVDDSGVGAGVTDLLNTDREHNIEVIPCNFGGKGNDTYHNEASIMWGKIKDYINIISLPDDKTLIEELSSRRWRMSPSGKIMIEPKSEYKKDFKSSPDRADALVLCFASKSNERTVVRDFDPLDNTIIKSNLSYTGNEKISSIYYSKDLWVSILYTSWDNNKLYICDEYCGEDSIVYIAINLQNHQPMSKIIGNERMFGDVKGDMSSKFRKFNIRIKENYNYNEVSSIDTLVNMINMKRIIISDKCKKTIEQLRDWKMDTSRIEQERKFGLCYALCNLVSDLNKRIKSNFNLPVINPYNKSTFHEEKSSWMF
jgi:hypothetical protein